MVCIIGSVTVLIVLVSHNQFGLHSACVGDGDRFLYREGRYWGSVYAYVSVHVCAHVCVHVCVKAATLWEGLTHSLCSGP